MVMDLLYFEMFVLHYEVTPLIFLLHFFFCFTDLPLFYTIFIWIL